MTVTSHVQIAHRRDRTRPVVAGILAWFGAVLYPLALSIMAINNERSSGALQVAVPAVLALLPVALLRTWPIPALALIGVATVMVAATVHSAPVGYLQMAVLGIAVGYVAAVRRKRVSVAGALIAFLFQIGAATLFSDIANPTVNVLVLVLVATIAAWTVGYLVRSRRESEVRLRAQADEQAIVDERLRIARELHDMVAHSIGIIAIQAGVGARVIKTQPDEARNALHTIETTSRDTLAGLRRAVGALRRSEAAPLAPTPCLDDLARLAESMSAAGVRVDLRWEGERRPLPADFELAAYRIVQEALTNVVRHSGADHCRITVTYGPSGLAVEVADDGRGADGSGSGYGLTGMRERTSLLGGELTCGNRPEGGFRVAANLPTEAAAQ